MRARCSTHLEVYPRARDVVESFEGGHGRDSARADNGAPREHATARESRATRGREQGGHPERVRESDENVGDVARRL